MQYTPQTLANTTWELKEYQVRDIANTSFDLGSIVRLVSPVDLATGQSTTPTFSWEAFEPTDGRRYQVLVSTSKDDFSSALKYITANTSFTIPEKDQLSGSTTYYWKVRPAIAILLSEYSETFTVADKAGWVSPWITEKLTGNTTQEIVSNKAILRLNENLIGRSAARLEGVTFDNFNILLENHSFSDVSINAEPTYHFRTQGDWMADNQIVGYFFYLYGTQASIGRILSNGSISILSSTVFNRTANTDYNIRITGDQYRIRVSMWESSQTETDPIIDYVDTNENFISGGLALKLAGSVVSNMSFGSISATFGEATAGTTVTSFAVDQADSNLAANTTGQLTTTTQGTNVSGLATFVSSDTNVVTVDANTGEYQWVSAGTATITATCSDDNSFTDSVVITALSIDSLLNSKSGDEIALQEFYVAMTQAGDWSTIDVKNTDGAVLGKGVSTGWAATGMNLDNDIFGIVTHQVDVGNGIETRVKELNLSGWPIGRADRNDLEPLSLMTSTAPVGNGLSGGVFPESMKNLKTMSHIRLKGNDITANITGFIEEWDAIEYALLSASTGYGGQDEIMINDLTRYNHPSKNNSSYNKFTGVLSDLSHLSNLEVIEIANSNLTGNLPNMPASIRGIFLTNNNMTGDYPSWTSCTNISHLYLGNRYSEGNFASEIPASWNSFAVNWLELEGNDMFGVFPEMTNWTDVRYFSVWSQFNSDFPFWLLDNANENKSFHTFSGPGAFGVGNPLPQTIADTANLYVFGTYNGNYSGSLPSWVSQWSNMTQFVTANSGFSGDLPVPLSEGWTANNIRLFFLYGNNYTGSLPSGVTFGPNAWRLWMYSNQFSGTIPDSWVNLNKSTRPVDIRLQNNNLSGLIPEFLSNTGVNGGGSLSVLNLSNNKFTPEDIVPHMLAIEAVCNNYTYTPQKPFGQAQTLPLGSTIDFSIFAYTNQTYRWEKDDTTISGETSHTIDTTTYGSGIYVLFITHPDITYTFESEPITVT